MATAIVAGRSGARLFAGEMLDLQAAVEYMTDRFPGPLSIVAASFGAVSTSVSLPWLGKRLDRLVLWNPVLDYSAHLSVRNCHGVRRTSIPEQQKLFSTQGFLVIDDEFDVGRVLFEEFDHYRPLDYVVVSTVPALVVHGDWDSAVSYDIARQAKPQSPRTAGQPSGT